MADGTPDDGAPRRPKPHARINSNLLNRPLARDRRVRAEWKFSKRHERWWCDLPGTKYVRYSLPSDAELRIPDGFDVAVLFLILRQARMSHSRKVGFRSRNAMLRELGLACRVRWRRRLEEALILWSQLSIRWDKWYRKPQYRDRQGAVVTPGYWFQPGEITKTREAGHVRLTLPAPIERLRLSSLTISIAPAWLERTKFETKVDLPLPMRASVQNLILALQANPGAKRTKRSWCRTAGLNCKARNQRLPRIAVEVSRWFLQYKGVAMEMVSKGGLSWFIKIDPRLLDDDNEEGGSTMRDQGVHNEGPGGPQ